MTDPPNPSTTSSESNDIDNEDILKVSDERLADEEYKIWKKNTPYLYDFVMTNALEWPSLTVQWLPNIKSLPNSSSSLSSDCDRVSTPASEHNLIIGTHTTGDQNYLMVASVNVPNGDKIINTNTVNEEIFEKDSQKKPSVVATITASNYDEERKEVGGFGNASSGSSNAIGRIDIKMKVKHNGEVNRARHMPQNHFVVASRGPEPNLYVWDLSRHPSFPDEGSKPSPQGVCLGHTAEGYGLSWSPHKDGFLISGSNDTNICLWDVNSVVATMKGNSGTEIKALSTFRGHTDVVEDVDWHCRDINLFGSVGDDKTVRIWDARENDSTIAVHCIKDAHSDDINSISFNPVNEFLFATGSADCNVALWDLRNLKSQTHTFTGHTDQVFNIEWAPFNESILASSGADRRVLIWELSRIGMKQTPEDAVDGPPELLFLHGGHTSTVSDFSWNTNDVWTIASVAEDNVLQVWNIAEEIYTEDEVTIL